MKNKLCFTFLVIMLLGLSVLGFSQGVTTASMKGFVVDQKGNPLFAVTVLATHLPTGTEYGSITFANGHFTFLNMKIGGPYSVRVSSVGYKTVVVNNLYLELGKTSVIKVVLKETSVNLGEVVIKGNTGGIINAHRTGAATFVNHQEITSMPTINRSLKDITRLTPESDGNSFGGVSNLYNNFSVDGSIFNNSFGLDYATPGGQTGSQPVSLDAIEQVQVSLAPFDVREGGFTGAEINAVTKSGTNTLKGTAYSFYRNEKMAGTRVGNVNVPNTNFNSKLFGVSVGGPIIKNKLFFFVNAESESRDELATSWVAYNADNKGQANATTVPEDSIQMVQSRYRNYWGYNPGAFQGYSHQKKNSKFLIKLNWNISKNQNLSIRYNMLDAWKDILPHPTAIIGRGPTSYRLPFENSSYRMFNKINSLVGELNSIFSNKAANKLVISYEAFRDYREPHSTPFPVVDIFNQNGNLAITAGSEMFSTHNILNTKVFQFTDNVSYFTNKHTITGGVNFDYFSFANSFNLFYYPWDTFSSVKSFLANDSITGINFNKQVRNANTKPFSWAYLKVGQIALYAQDNWQVTPNFTLTYGLRIDVPMYFNKIPVTPAVKVVQNFNGWVDPSGNPVKVNPAQWPKSVILWSPRIGFNWDVKGDKTVQLRGGTGIFSGRIPFVWLGDQSANSGIFPGYTFQVNATSDNFHWPEAWKSDLAIDFKFGNNWTATVETMYSKDINAITIHNYNMRPPTGHLTGTGDTRQLFLDSESNIYSSSPNNIGFLDAGTLVLDNSKKGYQYNFTIKISKVWNFGLSFMAAYNYLDSKDIASRIQEIASDAFQGNPVVGNPNQSMYSWSLYGLQQRIISNVMYHVDYGRWVSQVSFFYQAGKGNRYSYVYAGDLNQDKIRNNDLLYVPANQSDIHFGSVNSLGQGVTAPDAAAQWNALNAFINQDPYLKTRRGKYAQRNGAMLPWYGQLDFKFMQQLVLTSTKNKNKIQFTLDILNIGNLINSNWGVRKFARTTTPITVNGVDKNGVPYFKFDTNLKSSYVDDVSLNSKWQMQIGLRYIFN
jgi:hypothetical protein